MSAPTQAQLDDFARRLRELEAELGAWTRQDVADAVPAPPAAVATVPAERPSAAPPAAGRGVARLAYAQRLLDGGHVRAAVRELERHRARASKARSVDELQEILELARVAAAAGRADASATGSAQRLAYAIERNLVSLGAPPRTAPVDAPAPAPQPEPEPTAPEPARQPRRLGPDLGEAQALLRASEPLRALEQLEQLRAEAAASGSESGLDEVLSALRFVPEVAPTEAREAARALATRTRADLKRLRRPSEAPEAPAETAPPPPPRRTTPQLRLPEVELADLLGARALALVGGVVTLLGIVFFFVLAVDRGWVGPEARVALGTAAAVFVFLGGLELHRRFGETYSSLAAVGAGLAGGYATLLSAAALYDLLPDSLALALAAAIAAVGVYTSIVWRSQIVAGLGLIGAMLVPLAAVAQGGISVLGTTFVAVVLAATAAVALRLGWRGLLVAGVAASAPQIVLLVSQAEYQGQAPWRIVALTAVFSLLYVSSGIASHLRSGDASIDALATSLTTGAAALMALSLRRLLGTPEAEGVALLATAGCYALGAAAFFTRRATRDLSALLAAVAFILGGFGSANLLSGHPLVYVWAAETAALAWLARRTREPRFQVWAAVYGVLCAGHVLLLDAPPSSLFVESAGPASEAAAALAAALALAVFGNYARPWPERQAPSRSVLGILDELVAGFHAQERLLRSASFWLAGGFATYALSLGAIAVVVSFDWAFVAVTAVWSLAGLGIAVAGLRTRSGQLRLGSAVWLQAVGWIVVLRALALTSDPRWWSFLVLGAVLFAAALACELLDPDAGESTMDMAAYAATAAVALGAVGSAGLLGGDVLAWTWAGGSVALAWGARRLRAPHLQVLAGASLGLALAHVLLLDAPPRQLFVASAEPAHGVLTVVAIAAAAAGIAAICRPSARSRSYHDLAEPMSVVARNQPLVRSGALWLAGLVAAYALSLATLALSGSFDRGWVAVAALWSGLALAVLLVGLRLESTELRRGGLACLAAATAVVAFQAWDALPVTQRSLAYAVVAAALLIAGLAYALRIRRVPIEPVPFWATLVSLGLSCSAIGSLGSGTIGAVDRQGAALLGLALLDGGIGAALLRRPGYRDLATMYWVIALVLAGVADAMLLDGTFAVLGWAIAGVGLGWLSARVREPRFLVGAVAYLAVALADALILEAPPSDLFTLQADPAAGALAVLAVAAAIAAVAHLARNEPAVPARARPVAWATAGVLAVYGVSLLILQLAESVSDAGLRTEFQRGHTAVSAFWGVLGLALLYAGLTRWRSLRLAGLALFAVSLGKIFVYDLPSLSSVERALSFIAVGAVLLLGGFFYQHLSSGDAAARDPSG